MEVDGYVAKTCHRKCNRCWILIREAAYRQILLGCNDVKKAFSRGGANIEAHEA